MINLKGNPFYDQLFDFKKANSNRRKKVWKNSALFLILAFILSFKFSSLVFIFTVVALLLVHLNDCASLIPKYQTYYFLTFFPELVKYMGIHDLKFIKEEQGEKLIRKSGLDLLTEGNVRQVDCFCKESNEFNYFGYYKKTKKVHQGKDTKYVTTFDGLFFIKEVKEDRPFDFRVVGFKPQDENIFNKKGYTGRAFLNYEEFQLSDRAIDLLTGLQKEFGKLYISFEDGYLAIQFLNLGTCYDYNLEPCLKRGEDTDDHFKIIELSKIDSKIAPIVNELLQDISVSVLKK